MVQLLVPRPLRLLHRIARRDAIAQVASWASASQVRARRNAMTASTVLAQRRAEREDVATYFGGLGDHGALGEIGELPVPESRPRDAANG